jgi:hypothetical protein
MLNELLSIGKKIIYHFVPGVQSNTCSGGLILIKGVIYGRQNGIHMRSVGCMRL